jgi:DNA-binding transcriptional MerR regulator
MSTCATQSIAENERNTMNREQQENEIISIGEISRSLGLSTRTLRYWEEVGIIESVDRTKHASRGYTPYMVRRIKFIVRLRDLGLTIKEMQYLYKIYGDAKKTDQLIPELIRIFDQHIGTIDEKISNLNYLRAEIVKYRKRMLEKLAESNLQEKKQD